MVQRNEGRNKDLFSKQAFGKYDLWVKEAKDGRKRIFVPRALQQRLLDWYHTILMHPGQARMRESIMRYFTWPGCSKDIKEYVEKCEICQKMKSTNTQKAGKIPL